MTVQAVVADPFVDCRSRLGAALGRLATGGSSEIIRASAPQELAEACGFTRAMLSAVRGSRWVPLQLYTREELHPESATFRAYIDSDAEIPLANLLAETDMVRRRTAVLVDESLIGTRAFIPIVELSQSPACVAAPILVEGRAPSASCTRIGLGRRAGPTMTHPGLVRWTVRSPESIRQGRRRR